MKYSILPLILSIISVTSIQAKTLYPVKATAYNHITGKSIGAVPTNDFPTFDVVINKDWNIVTIKSSAGTMILKACKNDCYHTSGGKGSVTYIAQAYTRGGNDVYEIEYIEIDNMQKLKIVTIYR